MKVGVILKHKSTSDKKIESLKQDLEDNCKCDEYKIFDVTRYDWLAKKYIKELQQYSKDDEIYFINLKSEGIAKLKEELESKVILIQKNQAYNPSSKMQLLLLLLEALKEEALSIQDIEKKVHNLSVKRNISIQITTNIILRTLKDIKSVYPNLVELKNYKYKLKSKADIVSEFIERVEIQEAIDEIKNLLDDKDRQKLSNLSKEKINLQNKTMIFKDRPFEYLDEDHKYFIDLIKEAIINKKYIEIQKHNKTEKVLPLRLVFMENNWYLSAVKNDKVGFIRIGFLKDVNILNESFENLNLSKYLEFLKTFQTPFTKYNEKFKKAILKIEKDKFHYFETKKHFPYQKIIDKNKCLIEVAYTQPQEILPMIKKWIPDIEVIESEDGEIEKQLIKDLENYKNKIYKK